MTVIECEIRFLIENIKKFKEHLSTLDNFVVKEYSFTDHIFKPFNLTDKWINFEKIMRIRTWKRPLQKSEVLFSSITLEKVEDFIFKRAIFPNGKVNLFEGTHEEAAEIVKELDYEPWFEIEKTKGELIIVKDWDFSFVLEEIKNLGYSVEIEVWDDDFEKVKNRFAQILDILKLNKELANPHTLSWIYYNKINKKNQNIL